MRIVPDRGEGVKLRCPHCPQLRFRALVEHDAVVRHLLLRRRREQQLRDVEAVEHHLRERRSGQGQHGREDVVGSHLVNQQAQATSAQRMSSERDKVAA